MREAFLALLRDSIAAPARVAKPILGRGAGVAACVVLWACKAGWERGAQTTHRATGLSFVACLGGGQGEFCAFDCRFGRSKWGEFAQSEIIWHCFHFGYSNI